MQTYFCCLAYLNNHLTTIRVCTFFLLYHFTIKLQSTKRTMFVDPTWLMPWLSMVISSRISTSFTLDHKKCLEQVYILLVWSQAALNLVPQLRNFRPAVSFGTDLLYNTDQTTYGFIRWLRMLFTQQLSKLSPCTLSALWAAQNCRCSTALPIRHKETWA